MKMATIQIQIFPDGRVQGSVNGIKGKRCTDYIKIIEELTQSRTYESDYTKEFYENETVSAQQNIFEEEWENIQGV